VEVATLASGVGRRHAFGNVQYWEDLGNGRDHMRFSTIMIKLVDVTMESTPATFDVREGRGVAFGCVARVSVSPA